ncbi:MAG: 30S ribosomal protein S18 [Candidatus Magasanikbacteria bacterium]
MAKQNNKQCTFCSKDADKIDFRDVDILKKYVSSQNKIINPQHTGVCATHQRKLSKAVKRAREMALLPYHNQSKSVQ